MAADPTTRQVPPTPDPVSVSLDPASTALLVMDVTEEIGGRQPNCRAMLPNIISLLAKARAAGLFVAYTSGGGGGSPLADVAPGPNDPVIQGRQNKFFNTNLHEILWVRGVKTLILSGWRANGSILFTSHGATNLRYTVVVPVDGVAAAHDFEVAIGLYQILNLIDGNPTNQPLKSGAVTLSRTDLITFA